MATPSFVKAAFCSAVLFTASPALAQVDATFETEAGAISVVTVADGLEHPWGMALLPDGRWLVTERAGRLRVVGEDGVSEPLAGVPEVDARRQGGLLDVALAPDFAESRLVYLTFSEPGEGGTNGTAVHAGRLAEDGSALADGAVIFRQEPKVASTAHFGSRLVFDGQGHLFVGLGDRSSGEFRGQAQDLASHIGKIVRIRAADGSVPDDNPFAGQEGALPEIWSYGHRNIQGAAINPATGVLWANEHGPRGGDEVNVIDRGANYGWPLVSHGTEYSGAAVGEGGQTMEGAVDPVHVWVPTSMAPSGMLFYSGEAFPEWQGSLFVGALAQTHLSRLTLDGDAVIGEERLLADLGLRIRDVAEGPDGMIYVITDESNGALLRIAPAD